MTIEQHLPIGYMDLSKTIERLRKIARKNELRRAIDASNERNLTLVQFEGRIYELEKAKELLDEINRV